MAVGVSNVIAPYFMWYDIRVARQTDESAVDRSLDILNGPYTDSIIMKDTFQNICFSRAPVA